MEPNVKYCMLRSVHEKQHCSYLLCCGNKHQKEGGLFAPALPQITSCLIIAIFMGLLSWVLLHGAAWTKSLSVPGLRAARVLPRPKDAGDVDPGVHHTKQVSHRSSLGRAKTYLLCAWRAWHCKIRREKWGWMLFGFGSLWTLLLGWGAEWPAKAKDNDAQ